MRVWDIDPGFLNNLSLLGEHREIHAIHSILTQNKKGYARHPETRRWKHHLGALSRRHEGLVAEMELRGFNHRSPMLETELQDQWPELYIDEPGPQYQILRQKYSTRPLGRIPLPNHVTQLWASHKYSVMARDYQLYQRMGPQVAEGAVTMTDLARSLVSILRKPPPERSIPNALDHMWGYVSPFSDKSATDLSRGEKLRQIQILSRQYSIEYLIHSTALAELGPWLIG